MGLQTEIRNGEFDMTLYEPEYEYNCVCIVDDYSVRSQILTNDFGEVEEWMKDVKENGDKIVMLSERKQYKNGFFTEIQLLDWVNLLENLYDYMDDESRIHVDAAFQI